MKEKICSKGSHVSLSADAASVSSGDSYVTITAQWLEDWVLKSAVLTLSLMNVKHSAANIRDLFRQTIADYGIADLINSYTSDNGGDFAKAGEYLAAENHVDIIVRCVCHCLQLAIKNALVPDVFFGCVCVLLHYF